MRLQDIPLGARFEYEGQAFTKTGPLTAAAEQGGQRIIPRHAHLRQLDAPTRPAEAPGIPNQLDKTAVINAFAEFYQSAAGLLDASTLPALAEAGRRFTEQLKLR